MHSGLQKKVALVLGGSRGIGAAIVRRLAQEGADVAFTYVSDERRAQSMAQELGEIGVRTMAIKADSADADAVNDAVSRSADNLGRLDILVVSAGVLAMGPIETFPLADLDRTLAVNLRAVFIAAQAASRQMTSGGRIITIGSCNAERMPFPGGAAYAMSKAGLIGLVKGLARDLGPRGITVNNVQPGPVDTDMNPADGDFADALREVIAVGRFANTSEIAGLISYLASDEAGFVTGASLTIDGGFTA